MAHIISTANTNNYQQLMSFSCAKFLKTSLITVGYEKPDFSMPTMGELRSKLKVSMFQGWQIELDTVFTCTFIYV